jgi:purine-nucleoside/S-methyl-5'-thioadenosine phosphorylase / adenosine deaminase
MPVRCLEFIVPDWPAPPGVRAACTTRSGGVSAGPFASFNLAGHVGDSPAAVAENRGRLTAALHLPGPPRWLSQVHGANVVEAGRIDGNCPADASFTRARGTVCAVLTADCLPVLLCDRTGREVAAAHAGWRGLAAGILQATVAALNSPPAELMAWLGPAIGPHAFEVGAEVRAAFASGDGDPPEAFLPSAGGRWLADIYALARRILASSGVAEVYGGEHCTLNEPEQFYSHRRDGVTGRMAALIWLEGR